jgi:hypothetical protein
LVLFPGSTSNLEDVSNVYVLNNYIIQGATTDDASAINLVKAHNHTFVGNHVQGAILFGSEKDPNSTSIESGNIIQGISQNGVVCSAVGTLNSKDAVGTSSNLVISGNTLTNAYLSIINSTTTATTMNISVTGNTVDAQNCTYGLRAENVISSSFTGNTITNAADSAMFFFGAQNNTIIGNPLSYSPVGIKARNSSLMNTSGNDFSSNNMRNVPRQYDVDDITGTTTLVRLLKIVTGNEPFNTNGGLIISGTSTAQESLGWFQQAHAFFNSNGFNLRTEESVNAKGGLSPDMTIGTEGRTFVINDGGFTGGGNFEFNWGAVNYLGTSEIYVHGFAQAPSGYQAALYLAPTDNQSGTADFEGIRENLTETTVGSGTNYLFRGLLAGRDSFAVLDDGAVGVATSSPFAAISIQANPTDPTIRTTLFAIGSSTANSTTTLFSISNIGSTTIGKFGACNGSNALTTNSSGTIVCGAVSGTGGSAFPFTPQSYGNSTSSITAFTSGLISNGSTTITGLASGLVGNNNGLLYGFASSSLFGYTPLNPSRNINTTYPLQGGGDLSADRTFSLAFGTTTANTWSQLQTFVSGIDMLQNNGNNVRSATINLYRAANFGGSIYEANFNSMENIIFGLGTSASITTEKMRLTSTGNLGVASTSPFARLSIQANPTDQTIATTLFAIGSSTATATTTLFKIDNQGNITQSGPSAGSATKGTCFAAKNANANSFTYWYFPTAGAAPTYQTTDCGGAGTTTITYQ